jgi:hypothetical protein
VIRQQLETVTRHSLFRRSERMASFRNCEVRPVATLRDLSRPVATTTPVVDPPPKTPTGDDKQRLVATPAPEQSRYVAAPLIDSYHTVWFEFHEELLQATGRTRAKEAAAGRAD